MVQSIFRMSVNGGAQDSMELQDTPVAPVHPSTGLYTPKPGQPPARVHVIEALHWHKTEKCKHYVSCQSVYTK